jgi:hypothetical protein
VSRARGLCFTSLRVGSWGCISEGFLPEVFVGCSSLAATWGAQSLKGSDEQGQGTTSHGTVAGVDKFSLECPKVGGSRGDLSLTLKTFWIRLEHLR